MAAYGRLLIADDNRETRILMRALFSDEFAAIDEAEDGLTTVELLRQNRYSAVLLDLMMPAGGLLALQHLATHNPARLRKVVVVSAALHEALGSGQLSRYEVGALLSKPFDISDVVALVRTIADEGEDTYPPQQRTPPSVQ